MCDVPSIAVFLANLSSVFLVLIIIIIIIIIIIYIMCKSVLNWFWLK